MGLSVLQHIGQRFKHHELQLAHGWRIESGMQSQLRHLPLQFDPGRRKARLKAIAQIGQQTGDVARWHVHGVDGELELVQGVAQGLQQFALIGLTRLQLTNGGADV